ncbi:putative disease resistance protein RGA3, partial [Bienertia sinuspersici]
LGKTTLVRHLFDHDEDQGLWDYLRNNLQRIGDPSKSLVLTTTHSTEVAEKAQVVHRHDLKGLSEEDGWAVFSACENSCNFEDVGRRIVSKCKGVPLAIKAMGALLQSKKHPRDWESILAVELWDVKQCFGYCAILPKDSKLQKHVLIALLMDLGLLPRSKGTNSENFLVRIILVFC